MLLVCDQCILKVLKAAGIFWIKTIYRKRTVYLWNETSTG